MPQLELVCKDLLEIQVKIRMDTSSSYLAQTVWLEGIQGSRLEGTCPWCRRTFLLALSDVQDNAEVRCWHCGVATESLELLNEAHPGLLSELMAPAVNELLSGIEQQLRRAFQ